MSDLFGNTLDTMTAFSNAIAKNPYTGAVIETGSYHPSDQDVFNRFLENFDLLDDQETDVFQRDAVLDKELSNVEEEAVPHKRVQFEEAEVKVDDAEDVIHMGEEAVKVMIAGINERYNALQFEAKQEEPELVGMGIDIKEFANEIVDVGTKINKAIEAGVESTTEDLEIETDVEPKVPYDGSYGY